jgi:hypothetical protein
MMAVVFEGRRIGWMHGAVFLHRPGLHIFIARSLHPQPQNVNRAERRVKGETTCLGISICFVPWWRMPCEFIHLNGAISPHQHPRRGIY